MEVGRSTARTTTVVMRRHGCLPCETLGSLEKKTDSAVEYVARRAASGDLGVTCRSRARVVVVHESTYHVLLSFLCSILKTMVLRWDVGLLERRVRFWV